MFKIPLLNVNMKAFPDHGWRFGNLKAFYITIDYKGKQITIRLTDTGHMLSDSNSLRPELLQK